MAAIEEKTYLLCNYTPSKVSVSMRDGVSIIIDGGAYDHPSTYPFTLSELQHINNTTPCIKNGTLIPHEDCKKFIYDTLRIADWENILTNAGIEKIIMNPTVESLQTIIAIKDSQYFDRVYGVFLGLKNADAPIAANVVNLITKRYRELLDGKRDSDLVVKKTPTASTKDGNSEQLDALKAEVESLKAALQAAMTSMTKEATTEKKTEEVQPAPKKGRTAKNGG